jgi:ATPase family associated with various cellular activities (AAA)
VIAAAAVPEVAIRPEPAFVARVRARARRRVLWLRELWAMGLAEAEAELGVTHRDADRLLAEPEALAAAEADFYARDPLAIQQGELVAEADAAAGADPTWRRLQTSLGLSEEDIDLLALAVAAEIQPQLTRLYGYLQDEASPCPPSAALAATLFDWPAEAAAAAGAGLVQWALARPFAPSPAPAATAGWVADQDVVAWLAGEGAPEGRTSMPLDPAAAVLYPTQLAAMERFVTTAWSSGERTVELEFVGHPGSGRGVLAAQLAASLGRRLLTSGPVETAEEAIRVARGARLADAVLYWRDADTIEPAARDAAQGLVALTVFGSAAPVVRTTASARVLSASYVLPELDRAARLRFWRSLTDVPPPGAVAELLLTPAELAGAANLAEVAPDAAGIALKRRLATEPGDLFTPLPCPYTWDDIVLAAPLREHLREFEQQARWRWAVYEEWGFGRLVPLGRGISALFAGPSGTGKTMAAQVLARELGLDLYRIDLATVVNKYIGETEKRLKRVFDACERAGAILFFDEADALFGRRSQVKDAHDRYANIEIDYLLQRMEQFDGVAVLATNRKEDLDRAFLRRLRFIVDFPRPGQLERAAIWRIALPERTPSGEPLLEEIDFDRLATRLSLTGAEIKSAALAAAFRARAESRRIGMEDVRAAVTRELAKHGAELREGNW